MTLALSRQSQWPKSVRRRWISLSSEYTASGCVSDEAFDSTSILLDGRGNLTGELGIGQDEHISREIQEENNNSKIPRMKNYMAKCKTLTTGNHRWTLMCIQRHKNPAKTAGIIWNLALIRSGNISELKASIAKVRERTDLWYPYALKQFGISTSEAEIHCRTRSENFTNPIACLGACISLVHYIPKRKLHHSGILEQNTCLHHEAWTQALVKSPHYPTIQTKK